MTIAETFDAIYRENRWNGRESLSGPGSGSPATARVRDAILELVSELGVASVLDVGCGDGYWMPDLPGYLGIDISAEAVDRARLNHPDRLYVSGDVRWLAGTPFDLVICRDAIQHLPLSAGVELLDAIRAIGSRFLLASTYVPRGTVEADAGPRNVDIEPGAWYSPDLTAPPFSLPDPGRLIFDGYHYHETDEIRDPSKHLGLWDLRGGC